MPVFNSLILNINNKIVVDNLHLVKGSVYDLGCGTSPYKELLLQNAQKYVGVDWSNSFHQIDQADIMADLNASLPIPDQAADTVVSFQVLEHLNEPQIFLKEAYRILKPGGWMILTVPFQWHVHEEPYDYYRYTKYGLQDLFKKAGFKKVLVTPNTGYWTTRTLKFNYHMERLTRKGVRGLILKLFFTPVWVINQRIAPLLDKYDKDFAHTASYTVTAEK